jgi:cytoskeletal protein CcmA (bactofilin family)
MATAPDMTAPRSSRQTGTARRATLGPATAVRGQIAAREDLWVEGQFEGEIMAAGFQVTVVAGGRVRGEVRAASVIVEGELHGDVRAEQHVIVRTGGRLRGDLRAPRVTLEDGCAVDGSVDMESVAEPSAPGPEVEVVPETPGVEPAPTG